jgi:NitT/TauT family transport system permease protein
MGVKSIFKCRQGSSFPPFLARLGIPIAIGVVILAFWQWSVPYFNLSPVVLPPPSAIWSELLAQRGSLFYALLTTLRITLEALLLAFAGGVLGAILFARSQLLEVGFFPYAVILQVTPIISIAPLIIIWVGFDHVDRALLILATIVAFFPILSNTMLGLRSVDRNLRDLFQINKASGWRRLIELELPSALPYLLGGLRISGGLALIGAVVAEYVAGSGTDMGLGWRVIEAGNRLNIAGMFAALLLLSVLGLLIFAALSALQYFLLRRWHESAFGDFK